LKLVSAEFVTSAAAGPDTDRLPHDGPHVAMVGRSNVGKSSLINALCRRSIARTSAAPGKTRLVNVYRVRLHGGPAGPGRHGLYLVDLPGYGYARGSRAVPRPEPVEGRRSTLRQPGHRREPGRGTRASRSGGAAGADELRAVAEAYFGAGHGPVLVLLLVDARHPGLDADRAAADWLDRLGLSRAVVATKIDKLSRAERARNLRALENTFGMAVVPVSAWSGEGLDDLWTLIAKHTRT
jgi:GTP-binding protein